MQVQSRTVRSSALARAGGNGSSLSAVDKAIVEQLQEDGRRPFTEVAAAVGLSEGAVRQRVRKLIDSGVMQIVAVADPLRVGFSLMALVGVRVDGDLLKVADALAGVPEVIYVVVTAGSFDLLVELVCHDHDHLLELLNETIRAIPGITRTETFTYLRVVKETYGYGTR